MKSATVVLLTLLALDGGFAQTQTTARSTAKVPPPRRFNQTVPVYDVRMDLKSPRELEQEALEGNRRDVKRDQHEYFVEEPVNMKPPPMRERAREDHDKKEKNKDWLEIGDKGEDKKADDRKQDSGWGWLADDSRGAADDRSEREKATADEPDVEPASTTNSTPSKDSIRTLSRINDARVNTPGSTLADPANRQRSPSDDGLRPAERSIVADASPLPETYTAQRAAWMPSAGALGTPEPDLGSHSPAGFAGSFEPPASVGSRSALTPGGGWAPLRIDAIPSWTLPASSPGEPASLPQAEAPRSASGFSPLGGSGFDKPAAAPAPVPGLDIRSMGQKPLMDGVGVMPILR